MKNTVLYSLLAAFALCSFVALKPAPQPQIILIGDSTVKNGRDDGQGKGAEGQWGWGHYLGDLFDTSKVVVKNMALGGTSSRTFMNDGPWQRTLPLIQPGDYVFMQFGHNDGSGLDEPTRARGTIPGNGDEGKEIDNPIKKIHETVYSYGWYLRKYIADIRAKGGIPVVCSLIPRNRWTNGKVNRADQGYGLWAKQAAEQEKVAFIDLNKIISDKYDKEGPEKVKAYFFTDNLHTIEAGAKMNAQCVVDGIKKEKSLKPLKKMLRK